MVYLVFLRAVEFIPMKSLIITDIAGRFSNIFHTNTVINSRLIIDVVRLFT